MLFDKPQSAEGTTSLLIAHSSSFVSRLKSLDPSTSLHFAQDDTVCCLSLKVPKARPHVSSLSPPLSSLVCRAEGPFFCLNNVVPVVALRDFSGLVLFAIGRGVVEF